MDKFFLAYRFNPRGKKLAQQIQTLLTGMKVKPVIGKMIGVGNLNQEIKDKIKDCDALIAVLFKGQDNRFIVSEVYFADGCGKEIIIITQGKIKMLKKGLLADHSYIQLSEGKVEVPSELDEAVKVIKKKVQLKKSSMDETCHENLNEFFTVGMEKIYDHLTHKDIRYLMGGSKRIKVLKTWFPESKEIARGLKMAIENSTIDDPVTVELLLCKPGSVILRERSLGAHEAERQGSVTVYNAVLNVYNLLLAKPPGAEVSIAIYNSWPGCPVIWYDDVILMGFYFRGKSSPDFPWVRVKKETKLDTILDDQFKELWHHPKTQRLDTLEQMKTWLEKNKEWETL